MKRRIIAAIAAAAVGTGVGIGAATAQAEAKCPVWMCGSNGTELTGLQQTAESADRVATNGTQLTGVQLPAVP
jgi:hypothetical protein